jgi:hypothetical protein
MSTDDPAKPGVNQVSGSYIIQYVLGDYRSPDAQIKTYWNYYVGAPFEVGTGPFTIEGDGLHLISYRSVDKAGNFQWKMAKVRIDGTAPTAIASFSPAPNSAGWHSGPVTVSLAATDATSGMDRITYSVGGGEFQTYSGPFVVTRLGVQAVVVRAYDRAGNRDERTFAVRIGTPVLRISRVTNVRRTEGKIIADVGLYNSGTADAANPVLTRAVMAQIPAIGPLPTTGMIPVGTERMFTLSFPDTGIPRGTVVSFLLQGTFTGGTFSNGLAYSLP